VTLRAGRIGHVLCKESVDNYAPWGRPMGCYTGRDRTASYFSPTSKSKLGKSEMGRGYDPSSPL